MRTQGPGRAPVYHAAMKKTDDKRPGKAKALPAWMPDSLRGSDAQSPRRGKSAGPAKTEGKSAGTGAR